MSTTYKVKNLQFQLNNKQILNDISFSLHPCEIVAFLGPNGSGKTTTLKILSGIYAEFSGEVTFLSMNLKENADEIKLKTGYVPEEVHFFESLTGLEHLKLCARLFRVSNPDFNNMLGFLNEYISVTSFLNERIGKISKGMKQKIALLSSLIHNPSVCFFDEPLNGLDVEAVIQFKRLLSALREQGKIILYSSHILDFSEKITDRIILIKGGQIIADEKFQTLKEEYQTDTMEELFIKLTTKNLKP